MSNIQSQILADTSSLFDKEVIQNNLRGLFAEIMVNNLLGPDWRHYGVDWAGWDLEHESGARLEVKQSAKRQTWGKSLTSPRFSIRAAHHHYDSNDQYVANDERLRLADIYVFAWHDGSDQRNPYQWQFYAIAAKDLPKDQASIGLRPLRSLVDPTSANELRPAVQAILDRNSFSH